MNKVELCGVNTSKLPLLSNEEKEKLLIKIKDGDMQARELFIQGNLRLVLSVIQKFSARGENADDLFQVGCMGLIKAEPLTLRIFAQLREDAAVQLFAVPFFVKEGKVHGIKAGLAEHIHHFLFRIVAQDICCICGQ